MKYIEVKWHHNNPEEPVVLFSELDADRWERRKVEEYRDGRRDFASNVKSTGTTRLGIEPLPSDVEIGSNPEFTVREISKDEFESIWMSAKGE